MRPKRNEPCSCGSGKKWKKCCGSAQAFNEAREKTRKAQEKAWEELRLREEAKSEVRQKLIRPRSTSLRAALMLTSITSSPR